MSVVHFDSWQNPVYISKGYIQHRERFITRDIIETARVKNRRLLVNNYSANTNSPTMCIFFDSSKEACDAFNDLREIMFEEDKDIANVNCFTRFLKWLL